MSAWPQALGLEEAGRELVAQERGKLAALAAKTAALPKPTLVLLEWMEPIFAMGNWGPELVDVAGAELLIGHRGEHSSAIPWERVREADPEYLIVAPCGFDLERTLRERHVLEAIPGWSELRAVRAGKVAYADGNLLFNRSGMTVTRTAEVMAEILHGIVTGSSGEGSEWVWA